MDNYLQPKLSITTRSNKQCSGLEESNLADVPGVMLEAIQTMFVKELAQVQQEWQSSWQSNKQ